MLERKASDNHKVKGGDGIEEARYKRRPSTANKDKAVDQQVSPTSSPSSKRQRITQFFKNSLKAVVPSTKPPSAPSSKETLVSNEKVAKDIIQDPSHSTDNAVLSNTEYVASEKHTKERSELQDEPLGSNKPTEDSETNDKSNIYSAILEPVLAWKAVDISAKRLAAMTFEEATRLMQSAEIIQGSSNLMQVLLSATSSTTENTNSSSNTKQAQNSQIKAPGRVFVAGFLFAAHPQLLATDNAHLDSMVESSAATMVQSYDQFNSAYCNNKEWQQHLETFIASFHAFHGALDSWKRLDSMQLLSSMERHYLELDRLWQTVQRRTLGEGDEDWRKGIQMQRTELLGRIRTLGGNKAVDELMQKQKELRLTYTDPQPSQTPSLVPPASASASASATAATQHNIELDEQSRSTPVSVDTSEPSAVLTKAITDHESHKVDRILGSFDLSISTALQNVKLAHEIVLDPDLRLEPAKNSPLADAVQRAVTRAFFEHIKRDIESGSTDYINRTFMQLRLDARTIIPPSSQTWQMLEREIDEKWMAEQLVNGAFDIRGKYLVVLEAIGNVCAPVRDEEVEALRERVRAVNDRALEEINRSIRTNENKQKVTTSSDLVKDAVEELLEITQSIMSLIRNVRMDVLNHQLQTTVRPWLRKHVVEYEKAATNKSLHSRFSNDTNQITRFTNTWMHTAATRETSGQCTLTRSNQPTSPEQIQPHHVFLEAFLDLCFSNTILNPKDTPGTLVLDHNRIRHFQNELQVIISSCTLCTLTKTLSQQQHTKIHTCDAPQINDSLKMHQQDAQVFLAALRADDVTVDQLASLVAGRVVRDSENTLAVEERARGMVRQMLAKEDPVYRVIEQRVRRFLLVQLDRNEGPADLARRVSGGQGAVEVKAALKAAGLEGVQGAMLQLLSRMAQLCWLNWQVYQEWYSKIRA